MSIIRLENEINSIAQMSFDLIDKNIAPAIGSLNKQSGKKTFHEASCIFASYKGKKYIITAAHAINNSPDSTWKIGPINTKQRRSHKFSVFSSDFVDVAISAFPFDDDDAENSVKFYAIDDCENESLDLVAGRCVVMGLPASKNKTRHDQLGPHTRAVVGLLATTAFDWKPSEERRENHDTHFILDWTGKDVPLFRGERQNAPGPKGMSGGAIIDVGDWDALDVRASLKPPMPKLRGILTSWSKKKHLIGIRFSTMIRALNEGKGWPG